MKPLVSIIMVVYNSSEYLNEAIESVLGCNYKNIELQIADDNSTDNSWDIILSYNDSRIVPMKNDKNLGEYKNRNETILRSNGKYFVFVDGDDTLLESGLEEAVSIMENYPNAAIGINRPIEENVKEPLLLSSLECYRRHYLERSPINMSFARNIFRSAIVKENNFFIPLNVISGDDYIRLQLSALFNIILLPQPFAKWRIRGGQASQKKSEHIKGLLEPYILNHYFLCASKCPLKYSSKIRALAILLKKYVIQMLMLLKFKKVSFALLLLWKLPYFCQLKSTFVPKQFEPK